MKTWFVCLALLFSNLVSASPMQDHVVDPAALRQLASDLGIPCDADLIVATQERWLRSAGKERWELNELCPVERDRVLDWAQEQGLFSPWAPVCKEYDRALLLGSSTHYMEKSVHYLKDLWAQGIRIHEVIWLTGDRPLSAQVDHLMETCKNESEAARLIWEKAELPEELRSLPVTFLAVPMKIEGGSYKRPTTEDTLVAWLSTSPPPGTSLFFSNQPFCGYQFAVVKSCLPDMFLFDLVGDGADCRSHPAAAAIVLDTIARWIYQEQQYQALHTQD